MSTCRIVRTVTDASVTRRGTYMTDNTADGGREASRRSSESGDGDRRDVAPIDAITERCTVVVMRPSHREPLGQRFADPGMACLEVTRTGIERDELRVDDDAVRVVDDEVAFVLDREIHRCAHRPPEIGRIGPDLVERTRPFAHANPRFLLDF